MAGIVDNAEQHFAARQHGFADVPAIELDPRAAVDIEPRSIRQDKAARHASGGFDDIRLGPPLEHRIAGDDSQRCRNGAAEPAARRDAAPHRHRRGRAQRHGCARQCCRGIGICYRHRLIGVGMRRIGGQPGLERLPAIEPRVAQQDYPVDCLCVDRAGCHGHFILRRKTET